MIRSDGVTIHTGHSSNINASGSNWSYQVPSANPLEDGIQFSWYVDASDPAGNTTTAGPFWVTMADTYGPIESVSGRPLTLVYPQNQATQLTPPKAFRWTAVYDPNGVDYQYEISENENMSSPIYTSAWEALTPSIEEEEVGQALGTGLTFAANKNYYWRVGARDSLGNVHYKGPNRFRVRDSSKIVYSLTVRDIDENGFVKTGNPRYKRNYGHDVTSGGNISHVMASQNSLPGPGDYQWCVDATDAAGNTIQGSAVSGGAPGCRVLSLTDTFGPTPAVAIYPKGGADQIKRRVGFTWMQSTDHSMPISYKLQ